MDRLNKTWISRCYAENHVFPKKFMSGSSIKVGVSAFTLVELLVVISIIALLLSILMPSLSKARNQGRLVVCGSNYKQIGFAVQMYTNENNELLPVYSYPNGSILGSTWEAIGLLPPLHNYLPVTSTVWDCPADRDRAVNRWWSTDENDLRTGYRNHNVYFRLRDDGTCRADPLPPYDTNYGANPYLFSPNTRYCGMFMRDNRYNKPIKRISVRQQSEVWTLFHYCWPPYLHMGVNTLAYLDGHVEKERPSGSKDQIMQFFYDDLDVKGKRLF